MQDIAEAVVTSLDCPTPTPIEAFNLGSGSDATLRQLVETVCEELGLQVTLQFGAKPYHPFEPMCLLADVRKAKEILHWQPKTNLAYAIWQLAQADFPTLKLKAPRQLR